MLGLRLVSCWKPLADLYSDTPNKAMFTGNTPPQIVQELIISGKQRDHWKPTENSHNNDFNSHCTLYDTSLMINHRAVNLKTYPSPTTTHLMACILNETQVSNQIMQKFRIKIKHVKQRPMIWLGHLNPLVKNAIQSQGVVGR